MANVSLYLESDLDAGQALEFGADHIVCATGARWRSDGAGHNQHLPLPVDASADVLTPDDLMDGKRPGTKSVVIFDDDHYYMASVLAELLVKEGYAVRYVTPASVAAAYTVNTMEQKIIQARLIEIGVAITASETLSAVTVSGLKTACSFSGRERMHETGSVVLVTSRLADDCLYKELKERRATVSLIGDAWAPAAIAHAVYAGRRFAEDYGEPEQDFLTVPFRRELAELS
jgi:dimethylamine/trimethylamine dehydrogenase